MKKEINEKDLDIILDYLSNTIKQKIPWIQRKEISAWSALILYFGSLWSLTSLFINNSDLNLKLPDSPCISILLLIIIAFIFFRFIHSQYASIYSMSAYSMVATNLILQAVEVKGAILENLGISSISQISKYISEKTDLATSTEIQQFRGKIHPLRIILYFWFYFLIYPIRKIYKKPRKLNNIERQEAAIYSLLILISLIFSYIIIIYA